MCCTFKLIGPQTQRVQIIYTIQLPISTIFTICKSPMKYVLADGLVLYQTATAVIQTCTSNFIEINAEVTQLHYISINFETPPWSSVISTSVWASLLKTSETPNLASLNETKYAASSTWMQVNKPPELSSWREGNGTTWACTLVETKLLEPTACIWLVWLIRSSFEDSTVFFILLASATQITVMLMPNENAITTNSLPRTRIHPCYIAPSTPGCIPITSLVTHTFALKTLQFCSNKIWDFTILQVTHPRTQFFVRTHLVARKILKFL